MDETDSLDAVVDEMNAELADSLNNLGMSVMASDELSPADLLALTHEVSGTLLDAQQAVGEIVGDARMDGVPLEARPVWNMFDLGVLDEASLTEALGVVEGRD